MLFFLNQLADRELMLTGAAAFLINPDICGKRVGSLSPSGHTLYKKTNWKDGAGAQTCSSLELSLGEDGKITGGKS